MGVYDFNLPRYNVESVVKQLRDELRNIANISKDNIVEIKKRIELLAGERLIFTYDLHITYADIEPVEDETFCGLLDSEGEPLYYSRKTYFKFTHSTRIDTETGESVQIKYGDKLQKDLYISTMGIESGYAGNNDNLYFLRLPPYYYNSIGTYGDYDTTGYSTETQNFNVADQLLSKAR